MQQGENEEEGTKTDRNEKNHNPPLQKTGSAGQHESGKVPIGSGPWGEGYASKGSTMGALGSRGPKMATALNLDKKK